ncbi:hypothetical protein GGX14DRAFT_471130 [Mycena pura]|uniref:F-box domain-containing protein n=1 Tax=Mycena pura TaxID=153505 RepID=A0AAD6Y3H1_9AGAR|nr:hypothetical protein GGX14DRAFT_471130 [Mycena pura]
MSPSLPPELWIYIHRLAVEDISPLRCYEDHDPINDADTDPLDDHHVRRFLKVAHSLASVCRLWNRLAQELLYENVWIKDTRLWTSLSVALQRPDTARHVRSLRLSATRGDHNVEALHHCPQVEVLIRPDAFDTELGLLCAAAGVQLPRLHSLKRLYWVHSYWSSTLFRNVLSVAPNLEHLFLTGSATLRPDITPIELPNLPHLKSLVLTELSDKHVFSILRTDLNHLTHLTINPGYFRRDAFPTLCALVSLAVVTLPGTMSRYYLPFTVYFSMICAHFPALRELRYDANFCIIFPAAGQTAPALTYIRLHLEESYGHSAEQHLTLFQMPAFTALKRVVLGGPGWSYLEHVHNDSEKQEAERLRARGCRVEGADLNFPLW